LKKYLESLGIADVGLLYDLRIIPVVIIAGFSVRDVVIATPTERNTNITEVLGMNVLGRFHIGLDFVGGNLYLSENETPPPVYDPKYVCGDIALVQNLPWGIYHN
jgi:hypothetical protein